jgi:hypothetical protein
MEYSVTFYSKKTNEVLKNVVVESENDIGIILKAKIIAISDGFKFDKRKHTVSFREILQ